MQMILLVITEGNIMENILMIFSLITWFIFEK